LSQNQRHKTEKEKPPDAPCEKTKETKPRMKNPPEDKNERERKPLGDKKEKEKFA
jgi:hypothetical protein